MSAAVVTVALLGGCTVGPDYERPDDLPVTGAFRDAENLPSAESIANKPWWEIFHDEELVTLIDEGLQNNLDLKEAVARIAEADALLMQADSYFWPTLGANLNNTPVPRTPSYNHTIDTSYTATGNVSWEIDIWGKYRRGSEAARAQLLRTEYGLRATTSTLVANIAQAWFQLRMLREQESILKETIASQRHSMELMKIKFDGEIASELEYRQSESLLASTEAQLPTVYRNIGITENALSVLLGRIPGSIKAPSDSGQVSLPDIPVGLPSELLERRPDVMAAEQNLVQANANVGYAKSLFFPSIGLTGALGIWSGNLEGLVKDNFSEIVSIGPTVTQTVFAGGRLYGNYKATQARHEQILVQYRSSVLTALREVADGLNDMKNYRDEMDKQQIRLNATDSVLRLTRIRYKGDIIDYMDVLDAERQKLSAEMDLSASKYGYNAAFIRLYKALGGGWNPHEDYAKTQNPESADKSNAE